jgi:hypothetical protein
MLMVLAGTVAASAASDSRPAILAAELYVLDGMLAGDIHCEGLFPERIAGTVQSGLPAIVELFYSLETPDNKSIRRGMRSYKLHYDVWDDLYSVAGPDTVVLHPSFESLSQAVQHFRSIRLFPIDVMAGEKRYTLRLGIAVNPLQGSDRRKMSGWLDSNVRGGTDQSWKEQMLNLNDLIQHFFSHRQDGSYQSEWYRTDFFNPGILPKIEPEER